MVEKLLRIENNRLLIILAILSLIFAFPSPSFGEKILVFDEANLLLEDEEESLNLKANNLSDKYNMDIVIVTTNDTMGKSSRDFADDYFDYGGFGVGEDYSGILFLIDMDNGEAYISTTGIAIRYLTDERIESILDLVFDNGLIDGDYYGAAVGFLKGTEDYLEKGIPSNQYNEPEKPREKNTLTVLDFILSLIGGIVAGGIFLFSIKSKYKFRRARKLYSYGTNSFVNFTRNEDRLLDTFVTHRIIPKFRNTSGSTSGRSTTHRSSSGRTHGGGGRKF